MKRIRLGRPLFIEFRKPPIIDLDLMSLTHILRAGFSEGDCGHEDKIDSAPNFCAFPLFLGLFTVLIALH